MPPFAATASTALLAGATLLSAAGSARASEIVSLDFNGYGTGTLSGQLAWIGTGGSWAVSGAVNAPQIAANVIGPGVDAGVSPVGGRGRMVRLCTERFLNGRTKAWLDLANSGKWAAASARHASSSIARIAHPAVSRFPECAALLLADMMMAPAAGTRGAEPSGGSKHCSRRASGNVRLSLSCPREQLVRFFRGATAQKRTSTSARSRAAGLPR